MKEKLAIIEDDPQNYVDKSLVSNNTATALTFVKCEYHQSLFWKNIYLLAEFLTSQCCHYL